MKKIAFVLLTISTAGYARQQIVSRLDSFMQAEVAVNKFNGNILIAKGNNIVYQKSFGYSNFETHRPLDNNTAFELASVTKQFTGMAVFQLIQQGRLRLQDTLRRFFPELPYPGITVAQLLVHTSGLPDYFEVLDKMNHNIIYSNEALRAFYQQQQMPAVFQAGTRCQYSNIAYEILALIIEKASGEPYPAYVQKHIFQPLGMTRTRVYNTRYSTRDTIPNFAYAYMWSDSLKRYIFPSDLKELDMVVFLDSAYGAGGITSTTGDLFKWEKELKKNTLLTKELHVQMLSKQTLFDSVDTIHWDYGSRLLGTNEIGSYIHGGGGWPGYRHDVIWYTKDDWVIIVLSNNESSSPMLSGTLGYMLTGRPVAIPYIHKQVALDTAVAKAYVGSWKIEGPAKETMKVYLKEGKVYYQSSDDPEHELLPESPTKYFLPGTSDIQVEFKPATAGKPSQGWFIIHGMKKTMHRIG